MSAPPPAYNNQGGYAQPPPPAGYAQPPQGGYAQPPPPGYAQQPAGYAPPQGQYQQGQTVVVQQPGAPMVISGGCPACGGHVSESFTGLGICLAICFFPLGVLCCFLMMEKRCDRCGNIA